MHISHPKEGGDLKLVPHCPNAADEVKFLAGIYVSLKPTKTK